MLFPWRERFPADPMGRLQTCVIQSRTAAMVAAAPESSTTGGALQQLVRHTSWM
jgi:hypothetical protein